jgi:hypothetical protein
MREQAKDDRRVEFVVWKPVPWAGDATNDARPVGRSCDVFWFESQLALESGENSPARYVFFSRKNGG